VEEDVEVEDGLVERLGGFRYRRRSSGDTGWTVLVIVR